MQKKYQKFKWREEVEKAFNDIKELLISPPVLKAPMPDGLFHSESDTSHFMVFMQLLHIRYFEVLVNHKAIEYMIKCKTESPTTRLKTLLLKLSEYTIDLKYQKGSEMHPSDALSRLQNVMTDNISCLTHFPKDKTEHKVDSLNIYCETLCHKQRIHEELFTFTIYSIPQNQVICTT